MVGVASREEESDDEGGHSEEVLSYRPATRPVSPPQLPALPVVSAARQEDISSVPHTAGGERRGGGDGAEDSESPVATPPPPPVAVYTGPTAEYLSSTAPLKEGEVVVVPPRYNKVWHVLL